MKIAVCSFVIGETYRNTVKNGIITRKKYCEKHSYDYIDDETVYCPEREIEWSKIKIIQKYLKIEKNEKEKKEKKNYDFLVWIDADTFIMNDTITLESLIEKFMKNKDLMYVQAHGWVNNGVFFVRNTEFMRNFFTEVWNHTGHVCREQGAMDYLYRINWNNCQSVILLVENQREFNSFWENYQDGDFIIHFPGCNEPNRPENALKRMMNLYCPFENENENDLKRLEWLKFLNGLEKFRYKFYLPIFGPDRGTMHDLNTILSGP